MDMDDMPETVRELYAQLTEHFHVNETPDVTMLPQGPTRVVDKAVVGVGHFTPMAVDPDMEIPEELDHTFGAICMVLTTIDGEEHWFLMNPHQATQLTGQITMSVIQEKYGVSEIDELMMQMEKLDEKGEG